MPRRNSLIEPLLGHDEESLIADVFAPRVLHLEADSSFSLGIDVDAGDDHGVRHSALVDLKTFGFGQSKFNTECILLTIRLDKDEAEDGNVLV